MKNKIIYKAESRGHANHGWLETYHTFSFAQYRNLKRMNFGVLRVLNDDVVDGGEGFGMHPHENMEIISLVTEGSLEHRDSMGNGGIIKADEIQVMSAGTGIQHSEFNPDLESKSKFFQIWLFPNKRDVEPRYQQLQLKPEDRRNKWDQIVSPNPDDKGGWIHQDAWFNLSDLDKGKTLGYELKNSSNGVFLKVIEGKIEIGGEQLYRRDAIGFWGESDFEVKAIEDSKLLVMEVPLEISE